MELSNLLGVTRKLIGATFEGETKEADGSVYADVVIEGLSTEVRAGYYLPHRYQQPDVHLPVRFDISGQTQRRESRECDLPSYRMQHSWSTRAASRRLRS